MPTLLRITHCSLSKYSQVASVKQTRDICTIFLFTDNSLQILLLPSTLNLSSEHRQEFPRVPNMLSRLLTFACLLATVLATDGVFKRPKGKSFVTIDYRVGWPLNTTTPSGIVAVVPVRGGDIKGQFNGRIVENITSSYEEALPSTSG